MADTDLLNTGLMFFRSSDYCRRLARRWWIDSDPHWHHELLDGSPQIQRRNRLTPDYFNPSLICCRVSLSKSGLNPKDPGLLQSSSTICGWGVLQKWFTFHPGTPSLSPSELGFERNAESMSFCGPSFPNTKLLAASNVKEWVGSASARRKKAARILVCPFLEAWSPFRVVLSANHVDNHGLACSTLRHTRM